MGLNHEELLAKTLDFGVGEEERAKNKVEWDTIYDLLWGSTNLMDDMSHMSVDVSVPFLAAHFNVDINDPDLSTALKHALESKLAPSRRHLFYLEI